MKKVQIAIYITIIVFVFLACQKEIQPITPTIPQPVADSCRLSESHYYGGGGVHDSALYIYTGDQLTKLSGNNYEVRYFYNGGTIHYMEYYTKPSMELYRVDTFEFNANNTLNRVRIHDYDEFWQTDTVYTILDFIYSGNRLTRVVRYDEWAYQPGQPDTLYNDFIYSGNNITKLLMSDPGGVFDSVVYSFDTNPNYFNPRSNYFFLQDPFFRIHVGMEPHLPYFLSENNVINFRIYDTVDYPITYQVDSSNRPLHVSQGGFDYMGYKYECP